MGEPGRRLADLNLAIASFIGDVPEERSEAISLIQRSELTDSGMRGFAILAAVVVENRIDALLGEWLPGYPNLVKDGTLTFSTKINLLDSTGLVQWSS